MTDKKTEALKQALEALECIWDDGLDGYPESMHSKAITAIRETLASEALEQPAQQQEPVAWHYQSRLGNSYVTEKRAEDDKDWRETPLYTSPPAQHQASDPASVTYKEVFDAMHDLYMGDYMQLQIAEEMGGKKLYTSTPAIKPWIGLTEYDIDQIPYACSHADSRLIAYAIEAKLKEKNT